MKYLIVIIPIILALSSCSENYEYAETKQIAQEGWAFQDSLSFSLEAKDTTTLYSLYLDLTHTNAYPYQNLYYTVSTQFPSGQRTQERISTDLAEKTGKWLGKCSGNECELRIILREGFRFREKGKHTLTFTQYTRDEVLKGIDNLSIKLLQQQKE